MRGLVYALSVGRIAVFLLVFLVAALAARVLFIDARSADDVDAPALVQPPPPRVPEKPPEAKPKITVVDPDPDLDQSAEPPDCQGSTEEPVEPKPAEPVPH